MIDRSLVLGAWPLFALAVGRGLLAWQLYEEDGAERALARAVAGWVLVAIAIYGLVVPALGPLFPSAALEQVLRRSGCSYPLAASAGYDEPSLVFLAGTATRLTDPSGAADFLREGMICAVMLYEGTPLSVELPPNVTMTVVEADPVVRGQTASSSYKPGKLENGRRVMIPPHVEAGTRIVVSTADGSYLERAKD